MRNNVLTTDFRDVFGDLPTVKKGNIFKVLFFWISFRHLKYVCLKRYNRNRKDEYTFYIKFSFSIFSSKQINEKYDFNRSFQFIYKLVENIMIYPVICFGGLLTNGIKYHGKMLTNYCYILVLLNFVAF